MPSSVVAVTTIPRLRREATSPSTSRRRSASRTGVRDRDSSSLSACSTSRVPGAYRPSTMARRMSR